MAWKYLEIVFSIMFYFIVILLSFSHDHGLLHGHIVIRMDVFFIVHLNDQR